MSDTLSNRLRKEALDAKHMYPRTGTLVSVLEEAADAIEVLDKLSIASTEVERERCAKIAESHNDNDEFEVITKMIAKEIRGTTK